MTTHTNAEVSAALRQLADLVDATPDVPVGRPKFYVWHPTREEMATLARTAARLGFKVNKSITESLYNLDIELGGGLTAYALAWRSTVCERVVVGTREVTEMVPDPAQPAPPMVEQTRTEDIVEWRCTPLLAPVKGGAA